MSWSNSWLGKPAAIKAAMDRYENNLTGVSKDEFSAAKPALATLLDQNSNVDGDPIVQLDANGHGYIVDGVKKYQGCSVTLKTIGNLVE